MKKKLFGIFSVLLLAVLVTACTNLRFQNPGKVECPSCGYIWGPSGDIKGAP